MVGILFSAPEDRDWPRYAPFLNEAFEKRGISATIAPHMPAEKVDYILYAPDGHIHDFSGFPNLKAVQGLWAGVEGIVNNPTLKVPFARMVDPGLTAEMVEWITGNVLRHHIELDFYLSQQAKRQWIPRSRPLASKKIITILGHGVLGTACANALLAFGFQLRVWSRTEKPATKDIAPFHGPDGLQKALTGADVVILLLPQTKATENIMNSEHLALVAEGAVLLNAGRGKLVDDDALIAALDTGPLAHATLDVFRSEPLAEDHPFWAHEKVTVMPHIAAKTRPETSAEMIVENIERAITGKPMLNLISLASGY